MACAPAVSPIRAYVGVMFRRLTMLHNPQSHQPTRPKSASRPPTVHGQLVQCSPRASGLPCALAQGSLRLSPPLYLIVPRLTFVQRTSSASSPLSRTYRAYLSQTLRPVTTITIRPVLPPLPPVITAIVVAHRLRTPS